MYDGPLRADLGMALERYARLVYAIAFARARSHTDAEDIFQEVFLRLAQRKESFESEEHRKAWLIRVTESCSVNMISSAWRRHVTLREAVHPAYRALPDTRAVSLRTAMKRLNDRTRTALILYYWEGMKTSEIADTLGEKQDTVRKRLQRGRQELREYLTEPTESEVRHDA